MPTCSPPRAFARSPKGSSRDPAARPPLSGDDQYTEGARCPGRWRALPVVVLEQLPERDSVDHHVGVLGALELGPSAGRGRRSRTRGSRTSACARPGPPASCRARSAGPPGGHPRRIRPRTSTPGPRAAGRASRRAGSARQRPGAAGYAVRSWAPTLPPARGRRIAIPTGGAVAVTPALPPPAQRARSSVCCRFKVFWPMMH